MGFEAALFGVPVLGRDVVFHPIRQPRRREFPGRLFAPIFPFGQGDAIDPVDGGPRVFGSVGPFGGEMIGGSGHGKAIGLEKERVHGRRVRGFGVPAIRWIG
jgi:hypothetical protein